MRLNTIIILLLIGSTLSLIAQERYPQNYFKSPFNFPLVLSGSFGELRSNHFHTGLDIKTQGVIGKKVMATAEGYVSRIKVSPWGYGNALYITHPNGYTSVYAHLNNYNDTIAQIVKKAQYKQHKFDIEIFPKKGEIKVKQGQTIAYSGNSGSSGGPHLHFEIRNGAQQPINPLLMGIKVSDKQYPQIRKFRIYYYNYYDNSKFKEFSITQNKSVVKIKNADTISINTQHFYGAIEGFDRFNGANNKNGYYKLEFYFDNQLYSTFTANKLSFSEKRYINSYVDYREFKTSKQRFQRSLKEENSNLSNITNIRNNGIMQITDKKAHKLSVIAYDFAGQKSTLNVYIKSKGKQEKTANSSINELFSWSHENIYKTSDFEFIIPKGALYSSQDFWAKKEKNTFSNYSVLCSIYDIGVPLQKYCKLKIKLLNPELIKNKSKLCIVSLNSKNQIIYEGGTYKDGFLNTKTRSFGKYFISIDTIAPTLKAKNVYQNKNITKQALISFKVSDNLSGVKRYKATIDGKWVLLEYDPKRNHLYYRIDKHFAAGKHKFKVVVKDSKGNSSNINYNLIRD